MKIIPAWSLAAILLVGCAQEQEPRADTQTPAPSRAATEARIRELEQQARALAKTEGCDQVEQCASAPVGVKGCGGPHSYLLYCKATTDGDHAARAETRGARLHRPYALTNTFPGAPKLSPQSAPARPSPCRSRLNRR